MPIRTASMTKRISRNGQALHAAMMSRGADDKPSEAEQALLEERKQLKEERDKRAAQALEPKPTAVERMVRTHHAQAKEKPAGSKEAKDTKEVKKPRARRTRAEKHAEQAAAVEAARNKSKKPATK
jgi:hypothetical protein